MENVDKVALFEEKHIRKMWHNDEWYFSVVDVIEVLTDSPKPSNYWDTMKRRDPQISAICAEVAVGLVTSLLETFSERFEGHWLEAYRRKLGLTIAEDGDKALIDKLLNLMYKNAVDFTIGFRNLSESDAKAREMFIDHQAFDVWQDEWKARLALEPTSTGERAEIMRLANPVIIPRNHRIEEVIAAALLGNYEPFHRLSAALDRPFDDNAEFADYQIPPLENELVTQTFCGT